MPFVPVPNTCMAEMRMLVDGQKVENTLAFRFPGEVTEALLGDVGAMVESFWINHYGPNVSASVSYRETVVTDLSSATGPQVTVVPALALAGEVSGTSLPNNMALTISFRTNSRGRSFRGRNYILGIPESHRLGINSMLPTEVAHWVEDYTALITEAAGAAAEWVVVSRFSGVDTLGKPIPRTTGLATPVTAVTVVDNTLDSQRRRLPGRGT